MTILRSPIRSPIRSSLYSPLVGKWGEAYAVEAEALFARMTSEPDATRKGRINTLIVSLKDASIWSKLDALWVTAAHDAQAAQRNWIADAYNLTPQNSPTFTADRGYAGNGSTAYLDTGLNLSTATLYKQNSAHLSGWNRTARAADNSNLMGARQATTAWADFLCRYSTNRFGFRINAATVTNTEGITDSSGHFIANRSASGATQGYRNGSSTGSSTVTSATPPNANLYLLARSLSGGSPDSHTSDQIAAASAGASLTADEAAAFYAALNTYMQAVGAA